MTGCRSREALQSVRLRAYLEDILALNRHLRFVLLAAETIPMPAAVAKGLRAPSEAEARHESTIVLLNDQPFMIGEGYFPASLVPPIEPEDFTSYEQPTERILGRAGIRIASGEQTITATAIPDGFAAHLKIARATPVIKVQRVYFDGRGNPVAFILGYYHPERYQLTADIVPRGGLAPQIISQAK
jgi:GntR family transcriptional regulator